MNDLIKELASDPSCLLAITPEAGGSWLAPFRTQQPRNFAANPMTFTDSYTAQDGIGTDDFTLSVDFTLLEESVHGIINIGCMQCRYYGSTKGHQPCVWILKSDGTKSVLYPVGTSHLSKRVASVKVIKTGQSVHMVVCARDGSTIKEGTATIPDGAAVTSSSGVTTYPGNIFAASIRNDTTGTAVWQAAYSDLYDTSNPWPSPVPRNFAEEPMTWWDEKTTSPAIAEDDCEFFIRYRLDGYPEGSAISQIFYHNSQNGSINIAFAGNGTGGNYSVIRLTAAGAFVIPLDRVRQLGEHTIRIQRIGQTVTIEFDGEIVATSTGAEKVAVYSTTAPVSDFDGVVFETYWKSLTTGRTVWSYPSDAERVRLITKTNIRTDRGYFEQADTTVNSYVNTALDLRGRVSSYTVFIDFYPAVFPESNNAECHQELAGQGGALIGTNFPPICSVGYYKAVDQTYRLQFAQQSGSLRRTVNVTLAAALSGRCRIVGVVDVQSSSTTLTLYLDGEQIGTSTYSGIPDGTAASIARCFSVAGVKEYGGWINYTGKVYSCLLFDRALSAAEIAALNTTPHTAT